MPEPIAVVSADNHLQRCAWTTRPTLQGDALCSFKQVVDIACAGAVPLILAGDILDKQLNDAFIVAELHKQMDRFAELDLEVYYVQGQHELQQEVRWLDAVSFHTRALDGQSELDYVGGYQMQGLDWTSREKLEKRLGEIHANTRILVMHQVFDKFMGQHIASELRETMIPPQIELLIIGDFHDKPGMHTGTRADGTTYQILSPGSTAMQSITEPPAKAAWILMDDLTAHKVQLRTRRVIKAHDVWDDDDLELALEDVEKELQEAIAEVADYPEALHKPIYYTRVCEDFPEGYRQLHKAIGDRAFVFHKKMESPRRRAERRTGVIAGLRNMSQQERFLTALERSASRDTPLYDFCAKLVLAPNKHQALKELRETHFATNTLES